MDIKPIIIALAAATSQTATAQINSPQSQGYVARAAAMLADGNYQGCIDQCRVATELASAEREQLAWLRAVASFCGGMPEARQEIGTFLKIFTSSPRCQSARLMLATLTFYDGDYSSALSQLQSLKANSFADNEREDLAYRKAFCQMQLGEFAEAKEGMTGLKANKRYGDAAVFYCGYIAFAEGNYDTALEEFARCDKNKAPGNMADYYIGQILFKQGKYGAALNVLMPMLARKDAPAEFYEEAERIVGESFYVTGDYNRAMVYLNPYIERHRDDAPLSTRYIVGVERYQMGDYDDAVKLLAPVTETKDAMAQSAALTMGQAYLANRNTKAALMSFDKATQLDFDKNLTELAYYNYAVAQLDGGRIPFGNSVQTLEEFIKRYPDSRRANSVREYLVKGYMATDDYEGALRSLNAIKGTPSETVLDARQQVNFVLGTRALQAGNAAKAIDYLTEAAKYSRRNADIAGQTSLWLGDAYYARKDYAKALPQYKAYLKGAKSSDPNRTTAQYNLAYTQFGMRDYEAARNEFQSVCGRRGVSAEMQADCLNRIADTYYYSKRFDEAKSAYEKAYSLQPSTGDYSLLQMAVMEGHLGHSDKKLAALGRMIAEYPSSSLRPAAMTEKALTQVAAGRLADAIATYRIITETYPSTSQGRNALLQLGILYDNAGDKEKSKEYYRQVITRYPSSTEATVAVQDLKRIYGDDGQIEELHALLSATAGAPQLDAVEMNAIAAASLLKKARNATNTETKLQAANELLAKYPDAEGAEEALMIAAQAEYDRGVADVALRRFSELEQRASTSTVRHNARMGILRAARDMGENKRIIAVSDEILSSGASAGADNNEVKFIRAGAFAAEGRENEAIKLWKELAATPANLYGTRSAFELADHYFRGGDLSKASQTAEKLIDANPPHAYWLARTFILYSDILRAQGSEFEADEYLRALRSNYPGTENDIFMMIDKRISE